MEQTKHKLYTLLGFAQKSGNIVSGSNSIESLIGKPEAKLVILAEDSSENFLKQIIAKCKSKNQRYILFGTKSELGTAIGKSERTVMIVKDNNIAAAILDNLDKKDTL